MPNLVILTGAGISAESGISTFRAEDGTWNNHDVMKVATPEGFKEDPALVHSFYNERRSVLNTVEPNDGHRAIAKLASEWGNRGGVLVITQNVDDLHERGGLSQDLLHIHGRLRDIRCVACDHSEQDIDHDITPEDTCPNCGEAMRPDVVWFGEMPNHLELIDVVLDYTDIFISIGTSGSVMPASLFAAAVRQSNNNASIIEVNPSPTGDFSFDRVIDKSAVEALPALVEELLAKYPEPAERAR